MKQTSDLINELNSTSSIDQYLKANENVVHNPPVSAYLCALVESKGLSKSQILKNANINAIYGYQIFAGKRKASRNKLINLCIGAEFVLEEINEVLRLAEFSPLHPKSIRDSIIIFGINNNYTIYQINEELYLHEQETL